MTRPLPPTLDEIQEHLRTSPNLIQYVRAVCKTPQDCALVPHAQTKATPSFPWTLADMVAVLRSGGERYVNYVTVTSLTTTGDVLAPDLMRGHVPVLLLPGARLR